MTEHPITEPHIKKRIYDRQNGICVYCGQRRSCKRMTIDHIKPLSRGGTNDESNLRCICKKCNNLKYDMMPKEFVKFTWKLFVNSTKAYLFDRFRKVV